MYVPPAFRETELAALHETMRAARVANLVTMTPDGLFATPLPLLLAAEEGDHGTLYGHVARANPQWHLKVTGEALAIFMGPEAYISPSWYPSKQEHHKVVPTWNYITVQAHGPVEFFDDPQRLLDVVTRLTTRHEAPRAKPWAVSDAPEEFIRAQLKGIVGLRLPITKLTGKRKMSQNRSAADRNGVAAALRDSPDAADRAAAPFIPT